MTELNEGSKILLEVKSITEPYGFMIPAYMRNANSLFQVKEKIAKVSWEKEGEQVCHYEFSSIFLFKFWLRT